MLYSVLGVILLIGVVLAIFSISSRKQPELGLYNEQLMPCPQTPNCVCSELPASPAFVEPLVIRTSSDEAWQNIKRAIVEEGGIIENGNESYLHARFTTTLFRFIDDVELRLDERRGVIHIRSASRVGHSDMGLNRERVARLRAQFNKMQNSG